MGQPKMMNDNDVRYSIFWKIVLKLKYLKHIDEKYISFYSTQQGNVFSTIHTVATSLFCLFCFCFSKGSKGSARNKQC